MLKTLNMPLDSIMKIHTSTKIKSGHHTMKS